MQPACSSALQNLRISGAGGEYLDTVGSQVFFPSGATSADRQGMVPQARGTPPGKYRGLRTRHIHPVKSSFTDDSPTAQF